MQTTDYKDTDILTVTQVAKWLQVTPDWVRSHANKNRRPFLPGFKVGKYVRFQAGTVKGAIAQWEHDNKVRS
jgi:hypothetical protein